jgi:hypothetical protein
MFGFLSRKLHPTAPSSGTTDPAPAPPSASSPAAEPPATPSPPLAEPITDPKPLHTLIASVPAQTLHAYTLAHLIPPSQPLSPLTFPHIPLPTDPPAPETLTALTDFFARLVPPPRLHCVRCHKWYFEVENTDRSCLVPHNDESAEVERVGASGRRSGIGTEYETLWGCCGKTVEGDGDMGPPDGWCYEGKHTVRTCLGPPLSRLTLIDPRPTLSAPVFALTRHYKTTSLFLANVCDVISPHHLLQVPRAAARINAVVL